MSAADASFTLHRDPQNALHGTASQQEVRCTTLRKHIQYEPGTTDHGPETVWECELLDSSARILTLEGLDDLDTPEIINEFQSGLSEIIIPGGVIGESSIFIPPSARIQVDNIKSHRMLGENHNATGNFLEDQARRLVRGTRRVLAIRVIDKDGVSTTSRPSEMREKIFGSKGYNLVTQFNACSYGKLRFAPTGALEGNSPRLATTGVYEVRLPVSTKGMTEGWVREQVTRQLRKDFGETALPKGYRNYQTDESSPFDHVMYCLPPGTSGSWIASGYENSWLSTFNDKWCNFLSVSHEGLCHHLIISPIISHHNITIAFRHTCMN